MSQVSSEDYETAFAKLLPTMHETKERLLRIMMGLPNQTASSRFLIGRLNVRHDIIVNQAIGQLGGQVLRIIGSHPEGWKKPYQDWTVIATMGEAVDAGYPWKLRPQVVDALRALGFEEESAQGEEYISPQLWEGALTKILVNKYERSSEARRVCLEKRNSICVMCEFDFGKVYGSIMTGFIHVHHLKPLAEVNKRYEIDPLLDLIPVCPNCHAAIHFGKTTRSVEEVRQMMRKQQTA